MRGVRVRVIEDIERFAANMDDGARRQLPFAIARGLTMTAKDAQGVVQAALPKQYTLRNSWVKSGIRITSATKMSPEAAVGSLEPFMERQETGGRKLAKSGHRVAVPPRKPSRIIPRGQRPQAQRQKPRVFVPTKGRMAGAVLRRTTKKRYPLQVLYWLKRGIQVKPSFGFQGRTETTIRQRIGPNLVESMSQALGHTG